MLKTLGIIDACIGTGFGHTKAARRLGGKPMLEWIVRRATDCLRLDGVIVATCDTPEHDGLAELVPLDVPVFRSRRKDNLGCLAAALEEYSAEAAVRIRANCLFVDPMLIDRLVNDSENHPQCDYVSYGLRDGRPAILSPVGVYGEWIRTEAIRRANRKATSRADRSNATEYIYSHPEKFNIRLIRAPAQIDRDDLRLTIDMEEDWDHVLTMFDALGPDALDWQRSAELLDNQPALRRRMAALNRDCAKN